MHRYEREDRWSKRSRVLRKQNGVVLCSTTEQRTTSDVLTVLEHNQVCNDVIACSVLWHCKVCTMGNNRHCVLNTVDLLDDIKERRSYSVAVLMQLLSKWENWSRLVVTHSWNRPIPHWTYSSDAFALVLLWQTGAASHSEKGSFYLSLGNSAPSR